MAKVTLAHLASIGHTTSFFLTDSKLTFEVSTFSGRKITGTIKHPPYLLEVTIVPNFNGGIDVGVSVNSSCELDDNSYGSRNLRALHDEIEAKMLITTDIKV